MPFDVFKAKRSGTSLIDEGNMLMTVHCDDDRNAVNKVRATIGDGENGTYIYKSGWYYTEKEPVWKPLNYNGKKATTNSDWVVGQSSHVLPKATTGYFLAYICQWRNNKWNCGCADEACASPNWQVQRYRDN